MGIFGLEFRRDFAKCEINILTFCAKLKMVISRTKLGIFNLKFESNAIKIEINSFEFV